MLVDKDTQRKITHALAVALKETGIQFQAALLLVQVEDKSSASGVTIMGSSTGDPQVVGGMCYQHLRRNISETITVTPWGEPDPNVAPPLPKAN